MAILRGRGDSETADIRDTNRLEAFSDGVIAIAITLLIIEIHAPAHDGVNSNRDLWEQLWKLWPDYLGYLISFIIIGIMWANHHSIFRLIGRVDHYLVIINTILLLFIGAIPFTTAVLSEYLGHDGEKTAMAVYSGWFTLTAVSYNLLWRYASTNRRLLSPDADPATVALITRRFFVGPPAYGAAFLASFIYPPAALAIIIFLALLYLLPQ